MAKEKTSTANRTAFPGQRLMLDCGDYVCDETGVSIYTGRDQTKLLCKHPIMPVKRYRDVISGRYYTEVGFVRGKEWVYKIYPQQTLSTSTKIIELSDDMADVTSVNAKQMCEYFSVLNQTNFDLIPEGTLINRMGWCNGDFSPYISSMKFNGESECKTYFDSVVPTGSLESWLDMMRKVRAEKTRLRILLAASFASVILEPCNLSPFFVHVWGTTEVGKTVGLMVAASVWGSPANGKYIVTFNSTNVGLELVAHFLYSLPMCIDELQIKASQNIKSFDDEIYQLSEGHGRLKGDRDSKLRPVNDWRCCFITTGEQPIISNSSQSGAANRVIEVEAEEKLYSDLIKLVDVVQKNYGHAGKKFVEFLQVEENRERVRQMQNDVFLELDKQNTTSKQAAAASAIVTADKIVTEILFRDDNALTVEDIMEVLSSKENVDSNTRAFDFVRDIVARNPMHFRPDDYGNYRQEVWGKIDGDTVYFIKTVFDRELQNAGFNSKAFLSWAKRAGMLLTGNDRNRLTKSTRIAGNRVWAVCVNIPGLTSDFEEDADDDQSDPPF